MLFSSSKRDHTLALYRSTSPVFSCVTIVLLSETILKTILFSFGALMVAHHQGVFSIGAVMSLGMVASVAVFMVFLPALLEIWGKR